MEGKKLDGLSRRKEIRIIKIIRVHSCSFVVIHVKKNNYVNYGNFFPIQIDEKFMIIHGHSC